MQEVDINTLVDKNNILNINIPNNIIIVSKIDKLNIIYKYNRLDLSKVECNEISYYNQEGESIKNHILPNSLKKLYCGYNNLTSLSNLPNSLQKLYCSYNELTSFTNFQLPKSLEELYCSNNKLTSLPDLPNSLEYLYCDKNKLILLPELPNSLEILNCIDNKLISLPDFSHINRELELGFNQDLPISYIAYNTNLKLNNIDINKINIEGYPHNPITNQQDLDQYMDYIKNYQLNRIKSARK